MPLAECPWDPERGGKDGRWAPRPLGCGGKYPPEVEPSRDATRDRAGAVYLFDSSFQTVDGVVELVFWRPKENPDWELDLVDGVSVGEK